MKSGGSAELWGSVGFGCEGSKGSGGDQGDWGDSGGRSGGLESSKVRGVRGNQGGSGGSRESGDIGQVWGGQRCQGGVGGMRFGIDEVGEASWVWVAQRGLGRLGFDKVRGDRPGQGGGQLGLGSKVRGVRGIKVIKGISFSGGSICFLHEVAQGSKKCVGACYFSGGWIERFWEVAGGAG